MRDRPRARSAAAAQQRVADDGNVVVPAQGVAAVRAARSADGRPTASAAAGGCRRSGSCRCTARRAQERSRRRRVAAPSAWRLELAGQREQLRLARDREVAGRRIDDERRAGRIERESAARSRARARNRFHASMISIASSCARRSAAESRSQGSSACASCCHSAREASRCPPSASVTAASGRSQLGAPGHFGRAPGTSSAAVL